MGMQGMSPIIAAVLLIAITVTVGVIIQSWVTHWVSSRTTDASSACVASTNYRIDSAEYSTSTNNLTLTITNLGAVELYGFSVQMLNGTNVLFYNSTDPKVYISPVITEDNPLREQRSMIMIINMANGSEPAMATTADQIKVLNKACPDFSAESLTIKKE